LSGLDQIKQEPPSARNQRDASAPGSGTQAMVDAVVGKVSDEALEPSRRRVSDGAASPVVPDALNLGIAFRLLVIAIVCVTVIALLLSDAGGFVARVADISLFLAPIMFGSMLALGLLRPIANGWPRANQWAVSLAIPVIFSLITCFAMARLSADLPVNWGLWVFARVLVTVAVTAAVIEYLSLRARAFSPSLSEARLQALQARIRPHFLFNSLNTVLGLMRSQPRVAETTLENLSALFRVFMKDTRELIPLQDEVETCRQYLAIEQLRLGDRLKIIWDIEGGPADALVPSLLLQPLVENSVHHGIEPSAGAGTITIKARREGEKVLIEVQNPIPSESPSRPGNQMALGNIKERLMLLYDMEAELKTAAEQDQFRLTLTFPYRKERRRRDVRSHLINPNS
jgi:two-component system, LytTR family, sensor histidine kinase AlgZ